METAPAKLRNLLERDGVVRAPGVYDGISARLAEEAGFAAAYVTGGGASTAVIGHPDLGLMTMTEMASHGRRLAEAVDIPLIADADTGYGNPLNVARTVREYEKAGLAGLHIEDQVFPKRCGHLPNKEVVPAEEMAAKVEAAVAARQDQDFVIIARTDARAPLGLEEAIRRANIYAEAGADLLFVEAPQSAAEVQEIAASVKGPLLVNMIAKSDTPPVSLRDLETWGFKVAIFPMVCLSASYHSIKHALQHLMEFGDDDMGDANLEPKKLFQLVGLDEWLDREQRYARGSKDS